MHSSKRPQPASRSPRPRPSPPGSLARSSPGRGAAIAGPGAARDTARRRAGPPGSVAGPRSHALALSGLESSAGSGSSYLSDEPRDASQPESVQLCPIQPNPYADLDRVDSTRFREALRRAEGEKSSEDVDFDSTLVQPLTFLPEDIEIVTELAYDYLMSGAFEVARVLYLGLVALEPGRGHHRLGLGLALDRLGRPEAAERQYAAAARCAPDDPLPLINMAELALARSDRPRAKRLLDEAAHLDHSDERIPRKARSLRSLISVQESRNSL